MSIMIKNYDVRGIRKMVNRDIYNETLQKIKQISSHYSGEDFENFLNRIVEIRDNFDIKLIVVGHFSAGKSSLLNGLIGRRNFLKEAQEPTTAISTELKYDEIELAFAFDIDGEKEEIDLEKKYYPNQYSHLEYRINVPELQIIRDFTIVDTPGFDAGIEAHAKALANYIGFGSAYLVVIDQEKGGIDQTTLEFVQEISHYSGQIAILINKCDKITPEIADEIAESSRFTLETDGFPYKVYTISKKDKDLSNKMISIITGFNAQEAFEKVLLKQIKTELINIEKLLSVMKSKIYLDTFDLDADIALYSRLEQQISGTFDRKREDAKEELDTLVQEVIGKIKFALISRADSIAEALQSGNRIAAEAIILETIRPTMLDVMKDISFRQIDNIVDAIDFTGLVNELEEIDLTAVVVNLAGNIKDLIDQGAFRLKSIKETENTDKKKNVYRTIMGIGAIATNVVSPWIEIVIILLPDIISLVQGIFSESQAEIAKRRFINNVVPQIMNKIYPEIKQNVAMTTASVLDEYEKMINEKITIVKNNLLDAQNKRKLKTEEFEQYKTMVAEDIVIVKELKNELG